MSQTVQAAVDIRTKKPRRRSLIAIGILILLASVAAVAIPVWLIMPFKAQTPGGIQISYLFRRWSPIVTIIATGSLIALSIYLWRAARWWTRGFLVIMMLISFVPAWA